jgi:hypothetical protein
VAGAFGWAVNGSPQHLTNCVRPTHGLEPDANAFRLILRSLRLCRGKDFRVAARRTWCEAGFRISAGTFGLRTHQSLHVVTGREVLSGGTELPKSRLAPCVIASCIADCNLGLQPPESLHNARDVLRSLLRNCASYEITACLRPCLSVFPRADVAGYAV